MLTANTIICIFQGNLPVTLQVRAPKLAEYKVGSPQPENSPSSMTYIETADVSVVSLEVPIPEYAPWSRCRRRHPAKC